MPVKSFPIKLPQADKPKSALEPIRPAIDPTLRRAMRRPWDNTAGSFDKKASSSDNKASSFDKQASSLDNKASCLDHKASSLDKRRALPGKADAESLFIESPQIVHLE